MKLYQYFRSSASYRVRIALALKGIAYESIPIDLRRDEQLDPSFVSRSPQGLVPVLEVPRERGSIRISQSLAILEYLEERFPNPPLLPSTPEARARVRQLAALICCDIHPLNNLRVLRYLEHDLQIEETARRRWYAHWIERGLSALEQEAQRAPKERFCCGDVPTLADVCLIPQLYNARRYACDLAPYPRLCAIDAACAEIDAFAGAAPERQPDANA